MEMQHCTNGISILSFHPMEHATSIAHSVW